MKKLIYPLTPLLIEERDKGGVYILIIFNANKF